MTAKAKESKIFEISVAEGVTDDVIPGEPIEVKLPGDGEIVTLHPPSSTTFMMLLATVRASENMDAVADIINGFMSLLDDDDAREVRGRLFDRNDPLNMDGITDAFIHAVEEWSARPTSAPGRSPSSRSSAGNRSTAKRRTGA